MKIRIYSFLLFFSLATVKAQTGFSKFPRTYYPQAFFNSQEAKKALEKGSSAIKGVVYGVDYIKGGTVIANEGTTVILFPYSDYINEWLNLTNRNKKNNNSVYLLPEVFEYRKETTTDYNGNYTFTNLKPGKYYIETIATYNTTGMDTQQTGTYSYYNMDRYGNMSGGSVPTYGIYTYQYATAKRLYKVVEIDETGEVKKANLKPTPLVPFVDLDVVGAKTSKVKCYEESGSLNGNCITYHLNGKTKINAEWRKNVYDGEYKEYSDKEFLIAEGNFRKGYKIDIWKYYDITTEKLFATENYVFKNDSSTLEGAITFYYPSGSIKEINEYVNGKMNGEMLVYYENGVLKIKGTYLNDFLEGIATYYSENGAIIKTEEYQKGKLKN